MLNTMDGTINIVMNLQFCKLNGLCDDLFNNTIIQPMDIYCLSFYDVSDLLSFPVVTIFLSFLFDPYHFVKSPILECLPNALVLLPLRWPQTLPPKLRLFETALLRHVPHRFPTLLQRIIILLLFLPLKPLSLFLPPHQLLQLLLRLPPLPVPPRPYQVLQLLPLLSQALNRLQGEMLEAVGRRQKQRPWRRQSKLAGGHFLSTVVRIKVCGREFRIT
jgi:hypothetical protein